MRERVPADDEPLAACELKRIRPGVWPGVSITRTPLAISSPPRTVLNLSLMRAR